MDRMHVLIIEDDKDTAGFFSTVLQLVGYECEIVLSARDALARLAGSVPDLILLDMRLGLEVGGEHILYQLRSNPRFDDTRVIVITAYPNMAQPVSDLADLVLLKPVEVDQLRTLAQRLGSFDVRPKHLAFRDPISELFTREFFDTRLELAFERARRRTDFYFAVLVFTLQPQGQPDPDAMVAILRQAGQRLRGALRLTDTIARFSGWKFATLHEELKKPEDIQVVQGRLAEKLAEPYQVGEEEFAAAVHFGLAVHDRRFASSAAMLEAAEADLEERRGGERKEMIE
jgi:PleD family two-component response regulator